MDYATHLIDRITSAPQNDRVGVLSNELLREFLRGHDLEDLRGLLEDTNDDVVAIAIWIASELGEKSRNLASAILPLLNHQMQRVRFWALDCMVWATADEGCDLARGLALLDDPEEGIRRKVLDLLSRLSKEQLSSALRCADHSPMTRGQIHGLRWLISDAALLPYEIEVALRSLDGDLRKYGAVAAARLGKVENGPLVLAARLDEADISKFANRLLPK